MGHVQLLPGIGKDKQQAEFTAPMDYIDRLATKNEVPREKYLLSSKN